MDVPILRFDRYNQPECQTSQSTPAVWLQIMRGRVRERMRQVLGPVFLVGTSPDCDLVLGDPQFPESYAYLLVQDERITIRRLGDGPELLVNGEAVESADLEDGDRLDLGPFGLAVCVRLKTNTMEPRASAKASDWTWLADLAEA